MNKELPFLIYNTPTEDITINVVMRDETIWLTPKGMAKLFGVQIPAISKHLKNIFDEGELEEKVVISILETTTPHGAIADKTQTKDTQFYNKETQFAKEFYAMVQNKFHFAITGQTAAEIIYTNADSKKDSMGRTTWKHAPEGRVLKSDIRTAENYLSEKDIKRLERAVSGYFDYIEDLNERENSFTMETFAQSVNEFLAFRNYKILEGKGKISKLHAEKKAISEYEVFNKTQKILSDFDKTLKVLEKNGGAS